MKKLLFAFGDVENPKDSTAELLEEIVIEYIENLLVKAYKRSMRKDSTSSKVSKHDILYFLKDDPKNYMKSVRMLALSKKFEGFQGKSKKKDAFFDDGKDLFKTMK